jgi:hypothetical protein
MTDGREGNDGSGKVGMPEGVRALRARLLEVIGRGSAARVDDDEFRSLALAVFRHQFLNDPIYRAFCERRGATPSSVVEWLEVPAVPTDAFKAAPLISGGTPADAEVAFRTSGTSAGETRRGTHYLLETGLYRAALREGFRAHLLPDRESIRILSLVVDPREAPDSSLSFMIGEVMDAFAVGGEWFVTTSGSRIPALRKALLAAIADGVPVLIAGASFAFVHLLDALEKTGESFALPPGSRIMDTGGFKGRSRVVTHAELGAGITARLGIEARFIVNEYGMTEMSSQFYDGVAGVPRPSGDGRVHRGPGWVRTTAVDPETLRPLPAGTPGILRHMDLANLHSIASLQTADLGVVHTDGGIEVLGRATGAEERGCSIAVDELLDAMSRAR